MYFLTPELDDDDTSLKNALSEVYAGTPKLLCIGTSIRTWRRRRISAGGSIHRIQHLVKIVHAGMKLLVTQLYLAKDDVVNNRQCPKTLRQSMAFLAAIYSTR
jgi:hypothetical protein